MRLREFCDNNVLRPHLLLHHQKNAQDMRRQTTDSRERTRIWPAFEGAWRHCQAKFSSGQSRAQKQPNAGSSATTSSASSSSPAAAAAAVPAASSLPLLLPCYSYFGLLLSPLPRDVLWVISPSLSTSTSPQYYCGHFSPLPTYTCTPSASRLAEILANPSAVGYPDSRLPATLPAPLLSIPALLMYLQPLRHNIRRTTGYTNVTNDYLPYTISCEKLHELITACHMTHILYTPMSESHRWANLLTASRRLLWLIIENLIRQ